MVDETKLTQKMLACHMGDPCRHRVQLFSSCGLRLDVLKQIEDSKWKVWQTAEWYPFFLTALRAGLRKGELIALKWGDIEFGKDENDSNRFLLVQRNYSLGQFTTPKNHKTRRVDLGPFGLPHDAA